MMYAEAWLKARSSGEKAEKESVKFTEPIRFTKVLTLMAW